MKLKPEITVLMCVYNTNKNWLLESIKSILTQSYTDFEFIIVLDGPTDGCEKIVYDYAEKDSRIIIIENQTNLGLTKSLNIGLAHSQGKFIARMDADDIALQNRLDKQYKFMIENEDVDVVGTYVATFGNGVITSGMNFFSDDVEREKIRLLFANAGIAHPTAFIRKSFLDDKHIRYDENIRKSQDYALWVDVIKAKGKIALLEDVLLLYRESADQISKKCSREQNDYHKQIIKNQLDAILHTTENEFHVHCELYDMKCTYPVREYQNYIRKLIAENKNKEVYDKQLFEEEVYAIWIRAVLLALTQYKGISFFFSMLFWKAILKWRPLKLFVTNVRKNQFYENKAKECSELIKLIPSCCKSGG